MDVQPEINPYQAPLAAPADVDGLRAGNTASSGIYSVWFIVFALNVLMPLFLGWGATQQAGRIGMFTATILLFAAGCWLCAYAPRVAKALVVGGVAIGLLQIMPILQFMAGLFVVWLLATLRLEEPQNVLLMKMSTEASAFVATIATGGLLMAAAFVVGLPIRGLFAARTSR
jgi:hypothetical protein